MENTQEWGNLEFLSLETENRKQISVNSDIFSENSSYPNESQMETANNVSSKRDFNSNFTALHRPQ